MKFSLVALIHLLARVILLSTSLPGLISSVSGNSSDFSAPTQCFHDSFLLSSTFLCSRSDKADLVLFNQVSLRSILVDPDRYSGHASSISPFSPWSHEPTCTEPLHLSPDLYSKLCVYTLSSFSNGRGISAFTTPQIAKELMQLVPFQDETVLTTNGINRPIDSSSPSYTRSLPNKGIGMLAKRNLARGDLLLAFTPVLLVYLEQSLSVLDRERFLRLAINQLPPKTRDEYLNLATIYGDPATIVQDVLKANTFEIPVGGVMHLAIFPEPSRMNHDCAPNAQYFMSPDQLALHVHATRPIAKDEEITIAYVSPLSPTSNRQSQLLSTFHFTCACRRCSTPTSSDATLAEINSLTSLVTDWNPSSPGSPSPKAKIQAAIKLIAQYEQEGLEGFLETPYGYASLAYNAIGDKRGARKFAALAKEAGVIKDGPRNINTALWDSMLERPEGHWSWRHRVTG